MKNVKGDYFGVRFFRRAVVKKTLQKNKANDMMRPMISRKSYKKHDLCMIFLNKVIDYKKPVPVAVLSKSFFVKQNAKALNKDDLKCRALWMAAQKGDCYAIRLLVMDGVDLDARDGQGRTALNIATQYNQTQAIKTLMAAKEMRRMAVLGELPNSVFFSKFGKNKKTSNGQV